VNIDSLPIHDATQFELLKAAGFHQVESVANAGVEALLGELKLANSVLKISSSDPTAEDVAKWIGVARDMVGELEDTEVVMEMPVNFESSPEVASMLSVAPFALPLPSRLLMANQLLVSEIPPGILLNHYSGDLDVRVDVKKSIARQPKQVATMENIRRVENNNSVHRLEIEVLKFRSTEEMGDVMPNPPEIHSSPENDRVALIRTALSSTNLGRSPGSRMYIHGVLHSSPGWLAAGAVATLLVMLLMPFSMVSAGLLFLSGEKPESFAWVPEWLLVFPAALPLFGFIYLIFGHAGRCQICGQKLFVHCTHAKNSSAHHIRGIGYILPLCFHMLVFRWFRCCHCGTPVRVKK
jgi:hypothetical protein